MRDAAKCNTPPSASCPSWKTVDRTCLVSHGTPIWILSLATVQLLQCRLCRFVYEFEWFRTLRKFLGKTHLPPHDLLQNWTNRKKRHSQRKILKKLTIKFEVVMVACYWTMNFWSKICSAKIWFLILLTVSESLWFCSAFLQRVSCICFIAVSRSSCSILFDSISLYKPYIVKFKSSITRFSSFFSLSFVSNSLQS